ncbi:hypothetical protein LCGC14_2783020 [marine sediment metagenome]|uniref:Nucleoside 2-deoxyribosyltransferase n=1 Tax=marine sediment metagenome TaxID=412755 RepID=A0A0F8ZEW2_9ZZZZ
MKFYVAGKWQDRENVKELQGWLIEHGHSITVDWAEHEYSEDTDFLRRWAILDIQGATECDVLIALLERPHDYRGLWVEMGAAIAAGKKIWLVGHAGDSCIFLHHPSIAYHFRSVAVLKIIINPDSYRFIADVPTDES